MTKYYVSPGGNNSNSGKSPDAPFKTMVKATSVLKRGDELNMLGGEYCPGEGGEGSPQGWKFNNLKGTESDPIIIKSYPGDLAVWTGRERGNYGGYPNGPYPEKDAKRFVSRGGTTYAHNQRSLFSLKDCAYVTIKDLRVERSLGQFFDIESSRRFKFEHLWDGAPGAGKNAALSHHITFKNIDFWDSRHRNGRIFDTWWVWFENCRFSFGSWARIGGGGGFNTINTHYLHVTRCLFDHQCGEIIVFAKPEGGYPYNFYCWNNIFMDNEDGVYSSAGTHHALCGNFFYRTPQEMAAPLPITDGHVTGLNIRTGECDTLPWTDIREVIAVGNIFVNMDSAIKCRCDPEGHKPTAGISGPNEEACEVYVPQPWEDVYLCNNTIVDCTKDNIETLVVTGKNVTVKNNIFQGTNNPYKQGYAKGHNFNQWDFDYNLYDVGSGAVPSKFRGPNDKYGQNAQLVNPKGPTKPPVYKDTAHANYWVNFELKPGWNDASGFRIKDSSPAKNAGLDLPEPTFWRNDPYSFSALDFYNMAFDFSGVGYTGPKRTTNWDIGAHEKGADPADPTDPETPTPDPDTGDPEATITPSATSVTVGTAVTLTGGATGGASPYSYYWTIANELVVPTEGNPAGTNYTVQSPVHTFEEPGVYSVDLRVTDSAGIKAHANTSIEVKEDFGGGGVGAVGVEIVQFHAGDPSVALSGNATTSPKAIIFNWSNHDNGADPDSPQPPGVLGFGLWTPGGERSAVLFSQNSVNTTMVRSTAQPDAFYFFHDRNNGSWTALSKANVASVSPTQIDFTWNNQNEGELITATVFWGTGVKTAELKDFQLANGGTEYFVNGDYNSVFIPGLGDAGYAARNQRGGIAWGVGVLDGGQAGYSWQNRNNRANTTLVGGTYTDRISDLGNNNIDVTITSWDNTKIGLTSVQNDVDQPQFALFMKIDAQMKVGQIDMPTTASTATVNTGFKPGYIQIFGGKNDQLNLEYYDDSAMDLISIYQRNQTDEALHGISSENSASPTIEKSFAANSLQEFQSGVLVGDHTVTLEALGFSVEATTPWDATRKRLYFAIEDKAAPGTAGIDALFSVNLVGSTENWGGVAVTGQDLAFKNLSTSSGTITSYLWDYGDGTGSTLENPVKAYTRPGTFTVKLTITDSNGESDTAQGTLTIVSDPPTVTFNPLVDIEPSEGDIPLTSMITFNGFTAGSGRVIENIRWMVTNEPHALDTIDEAEAADVSDTADEQQSFSFAVGGNAQPGDTVGVVTTEPGTYKLEIDVIYADSEIVDGKPVDTFPYTYHDAITAYAVDEKVKHITATNGVGRKPMGEYTDEVWVVADGIELKDGSVYADIEWDMGDGTIYSGVWVPEHTYAAVSVPTEYQVTAILTDHEGVEYFVTADPFVTLYPEAPAPTWPADSLDNFAQRLAEFNQLFMLPGPWISYAPGVWQSVGAFAPMVSETDVIAEDALDMKPAASVGSIIPGECFIEMGIEITDPVDDQPIDMYTADFISEFDFQNLVSTDGLVGLEFRFKDGYTKWQFRIGSNGSLMLRKREGEADTWTVVASSISWTADDAQHTARLSVYGNSLTASVDGVEHLTATLTSFNEEYTAGEVFDLTGIMSRLEVNAALIIAHVSPADGTDPNTSDHCYMVKRRI